MVCLLCGYAGNFGKIEVSSSDGYATATGWTPTNGHIGSVTIFVCSSCGALHSTMNGSIIMPERKV